MACISSCVDSSHGALFSTLIGLLVALITIMVDLEDRQSERTFRAWQVVRGFETRVVEPEPNTPSGTSGSSLREALEFLNREFAGFLCVPPVALTSDLLTGNSRRECLFPKKERESFSGLEARAVVLTRIELPGADLRRADLTTSDLGGANLTRANLLGADIPNSDLTEAVFSHAVLRFIDLTHSVLIGANFTGANLTDANLTEALLLGAKFTDANLTKANFLTQAQLDVACGTSAPRGIPPGLTWTSRPCP